MFFPKSGLEKIEFSSSSAEEPNHFVIDLEEENDIVNDPAARKFDLLSKSLSVFFFQNVKLIYILVS